MNKDKAMEKLRARLDELEIKLGTYRAGLQLETEHNVSPIRAKAIAEFFRRFINGNT